MAGAGPCSAALGLGVLTAGPCSSLGLGVLTAGPCSPALGLGVLTAGPCSAALGLGVLTAGAIPLDPFYRVCLSNIFLAVYLFEEIDEQGC